MMRRKSKLGRQILGALALTSASLGVQAHAQQADGFLGSDIPFNPARGDAIAVTKRAHPELDPVGIRTGGMIVFPSLTAGLGYTNNVFGATNGGQGDGYEILAPSVSGVSQWSRHSLELNVGAGLKRFMSQTTRNQTAYSVQATGRLDLGTKGDNIVGLVHHMRGFESQYSGAFPNNAAGTVAYYQNEALLRGTFAINRAHLIISGKVNDLNYDDTLSLTGAVIDQQYRDRVEYISGARIEYDLPADAKAFAELSYSIVDYRIATASQPLRSNHTTRALAGVNFKITPLIRVIVGAGYERRDYRVASYGAISGLVGDLRVEWLPTELTTINFQLSRKVDDAIFVNSPGYFATSGRVHVDHELLRSVILFAEANFERDSYVATQRLDQQFQILGGATYSLNRRVKVQPSFRYIRRKSEGSVAGLSFEELRGEVDLVVSL